MRNKRQENIDRLTTFMAIVSAKKEYDDNLMLDKYTVNTRLCGPLTVMYMEESNTDDWLACRFQDVDKAKQVMGDENYPGSFNKHSGKWNWDMENFEIFKSTLTQFM